VRFTSDFIPGAGVLLPATVFGDFDLDLDVDTDDITLFFQKVVTGELTNDLSYDLNGDGKVSTYDMQNFAKLCTYDLCAGE
jgi:hypothetical protein